MLVTHLLVVDEPALPLPPVPAVAGVPDPDVHGIGMTVPLRYGPQPPLLALAAADVGLTAAEITMQPRISVQSVNPIGFRPAPRRAPFFVSPYMPGPRRPGTARAKHRLRGPAE